MEFWCIEPVDVFCGRGNRLFGEAGSFGTVGIPPWPSVFAGALRSKILASNGADPLELLLGRLTGPLAQVVGNGLPTGSMLEDGSKEYAIAPGKLRLTWLSLQRKGNIAVPLPYDLFSGNASSESTWGSKPSGLSEDSSVVFLKPIPLPTGIEASKPTDQLLVARSDRLAKQETGFWLGAEGLRMYLNGFIPTKDQLVRADELWKPEERVGIGMTSATRTVETGKLFTTEAVRLLNETVFLVGLEGTDGTLPSAGILRLGGDGKGAHFSKTKEVDPWNWVDLDEIQESGRFRLVLSTPGLFTDGWLPFGVDPQSHRLEWSAQGHKMSAKLVAAALPRFDVVSGWDLAREQPKKAQRVVPAWSVYWFEGAAGDIKAVLRSILEGGLWEIVRPMWDGKEGDESVILWKERRAEGFNNVLLGLWPK